MGKVWITRVKRTLPPPPFVYLIRSNDRVRRTLQLETAFKTLKTMNVLRYSLQTQRATVSKGVSDLIYRLGSSVKADMVSCELLVVV